VTTADTTTYPLAVDEHPAIDHRRPRGALRRAWDDVAGLLLLTLRLLWRHWPVLLSLALAGTFAREWVREAAVKATDAGAIAGLLVFLLMPMSLLIAIVLMLRAVRPSLPTIGRTPFEPVLGHLGAVLIPFLVFYLNTGLMDTDWQRFGYSVAVSKIIFSGDPSQSSRMVTAGVGVLVLAAVAFVVRWLLNRFDVVRRRPVLGLPAAYLELVWLLSLALMLRDWLPRVEAWRDERVAWQAGLKIWRSDFAGLGVAAGPLRELRDLFNLAWGTVDDVLVTPIAALISAGVVLAASTAMLNRTAPSRSALIRVLRIGGFAGRPVGRLASIGRFLATLRLVFRSGVVFTMIYCLVFVAVFTVDDWLYLPERWLIGPRSVRLVWQPLEFPLSWLNQAIGLVLLICLIAAAVERSPLGSAGEARSGEARSGESRSGESRSDGTAARRSGDGEADIAR
jgi:hypothetical protein